MQATEYSVRSNETADRIPHSLLTDPEMLMRLRSVKQRKLRRKQNKMNHIPDNVSKYDNVYDVLKERGSYRTDH